MKQEDIKEDNLQPQRHEAETGRMHIKRYNDGRSRLRVQFDITYKGHPGVLKEGESATEPDMTLSLQQLLERHTRGKDVPMKQPIYFETEIPTFSDMTDVERYKEQLEDRLKETKNFIKQEQIETAKAKKEAAEQKAKEEEAKSIKAQKNEQKATDSQESTED